jgi:hypothetical protein
MSDSASPLEVFATPVSVPVTDVSAPDGAAEAAPAGDGATVPNPAPAEADRIPEFYVSKYDVSEAPKLSIKQITALKCLANGESIQDAALTAHVTRTTVWRWMTNHPAFRAAYNRWKAAADLSARSRLVALQDLAVEVVTEELADKRNGRLAAMILSKMGTLTPTPTGATEERRAAKEIETEQRKRDIDMARAAGDLDSTYFPSEHLIKDDPPAPKVEQPAAEGTQSH